MNIMYGVEIPAISKNKNNHTELTIAMKNFIESSEKTMAISLKTRQEAERIAGCARMYLYSHKLVSLYGVAKRNNTVYVFKKEA